jgi:hypothetical protein
MRVLWFVSLLVFILTSCSNFVCRKSQTENNANTANRKVLSGFFDTLSVRKFKTTINFKTTEMSGILIYKKMNDSTSAGSFVNEFGIKVFDFTLTQNQARLQNVFRKLDKWYIRRILETDLHFMFIKPKLLTPCSKSDTTVSVATIRPYLHYVYYNVDNKNPGRADLYKRAHKISSLQQHFGELGELVLNMEHTDGSLKYEFCEIKN